MTTDEIITWLMAYAKAPTTTMDKMVRASELTGILRTRYGADIAAGLIAGLDMQGKVVERESD